MTHLAVLALLQVNNSKVFLEVICLVAEVHPFEAVIGCAFELHALVGLLQVIVILGEKQILAGGGYTQEVWQ